MRIRRRTIAPRVAQQFFLDGAFNGDGGSSYMKFNNGTTMSATSGYVMPRSGSLIGASFLGLYNTQVLGSTNNYHVRVNGVTAINISLTDASGFWHTEFTQDSNIDTFVQNDVITMFHAQGEGNTIFTKMVTLALILLDSSG